METYNLHHTVMYVGHFLSQKLRRRRASSDIESIIFPRFYDWPTWSVTTSPGGNQEPTRPMQIQERKTIP